jgi:predicted amidophosphoribosyltransferase
VARLDRLAPTLQGLYALAPYDSGLGAAIKRAKQQARREPAVAVSRTLARRFAPYLGVFDVIVPAPSTVRSRLRRGFSVAAILAWQLSRESGVPYLDALRVQEGKQQARLTAAERRTNLVGRVHPRRPVYGRVLWVDDVLTTGGSAAACSEALARGGAAQVWGAVACVARAKTPPEKVGSA